MWTEKCLGLLHFVGLRYLRSTRRFDHQMQRGTGWLVAPPFLCQQCCMQGYGRLMVILARNPYMILSLADVKGGCVRMSCQWLVTACHGHRLKSVLSLER